MSSTAPPARSPSAVARGFVVMLLGVSGTGKTTIGELLTQRLDATFYDADDFHSDFAKAKMASGQSLNDEDRVPWLDRIQYAVHEWRATSQRVIFACSGLKQKYRLVLAEELEATSILDSDSARHRTQQEEALSTMSFSPFYPSPLYMFLLHGSFELLFQRISQRKGHYFPVSLLQSQFDTLEMPGSDEDVMVVDVAMSKEQIVKVIANAILNQHEGGEIGSHLHAFVNEAKASDTTSEPLQRTPFSAL